MPLVSAYQRTNPPTFLGIFKEQSSTLFDSVDGIAFLNIFEFLKILCFLFLFPPLTSRLKISTFQHPWELYAPHSAATWMKRQSL
jgi:hypothetical protein